MHNGNANNVKEFTYNAQTDDFARLLAGEIKQINGEPVFLGRETEDQGYYQFPCLFAAKLSEKLSETVIINGSPIRVPLIAHRAFKAIEPHDSDLAKRIINRFKRSWALAKIVADGSFERAELAELDDQGFGYPFFSQSIIVQLGCLMKPMVGKNEISAAVTTHPKEDVICIQFHGPSELRMQLMFRK